MPRIATKLTPAKRGGFVARKVIPSDVREEYAKLYGQRTEERLSTGAVSIGMARARHREWSSEIEARIANIRAARRGEGVRSHPRKPGLWQGSGITGLSRVRLIARQKMCGPNIRAS